MSDTSFCAESPKTWRSYPRDPRPGLLRSSRTGPRARAASTRSGPSGRVPHREHEWLERIPEPPLYPRWTTRPAPAPWSCSRRASRSSPEGGRSRRPDGCRRPTCRWCARSRDTPRRSPPPPRGASPRPRSPGRARPPSSGRAAPASGPGCVRTRWNVRCGTPSPGSRAMTRGRRPPCGLASPAPTPPAVPSRR